MVNFGVNIDSLDEETRQRLGIPLTPSLGDVGGNLVHLGRVFNALRGLDDDDALQVLQQAQMYLINRKNTPIDAENISIPGDGLHDSYTPPIDWTLQVVAKMFKVTPADLKQRKRGAAVALARQVAMYVLYMTNKYTLARIGEAIGGRSPATVSHAFARISYQVTVDPDLNAKVKEIREIISGKV